MIEAPRPPRDDGECGPDERGESAAQQRRRRLDAARKLPARFSELEGAALADGAAGGGGGGGGGGGATNTTGELAVRMRAAGLEVCWNTLPRCANDKERGAGPRAVECSSHGHGSARSGCRARTLRLATERDAAVARTQRRPPGTIAFPSLRS